MKAIIDTGKVLLTIQAFDNRTITEEMTLLWHELLEPYTLQDCVQAVKDHYAESRDWLMPVDVINRVKQVRAERAGAVRGIQLREEDELIPGAPGEKSQLVPDWREKVRALGERIRNGEISPAQYRAYHDGELSLEELMQSAKELT